MIKQILKSELKKKGYKDSSSSIFYRLTFGIILGVIFSVIFSFISVVIAGIVSGISFGTFSGVIYGITSGITIGTITGFVLGITLAFMSDKVYSPDRDIYFQIINQKSTSLNHGENNAFKYVDNVYKTKNGIPSSIFSLEAYFEDTFRVTYNEEEIVEEEVIEFAKSIEKLNNSAKL